MKKGKGFRKQSGKNPPTKGKGIDYDLLPFSKSHQTRRPKAVPKTEAPAQLRRNDKQRREKAAKTRVRAVVMRRDAECRVPDDPRWPHRGEDQWAHLEEGKRTKTTGQAPEKRHTAKLSCRLCDGHHDMYDGQAIPKMRLQFHDPNLGADARIDWFVGDELVGGGKDA